MRASLLVSALVVVILVAGCQLPDGPVVTLPTITAQPAETAAPLLPALPTAAATPLAPVQAASVFQDGEFSFSYPASWQSSFNLPPVQGIVGQLKPLSGGGTITVYRFPAVQSLDDYFLMDTTDPAITVTDKLERRVDGVKAYYLIGQSYAAGSLFGHIVVGLVDGSTFYRVNLTVDGNSSDIAAYRAAFVGVLDSWRWK